MNKTVFTFGLLLSFFVASFQTLLKAEVGGIQVPISSNNLSVRGWVERLVYGDPVRDPDGCLYGGVGDRLVVIDIYDESGEWIDGSLQVSLGGSGSYYNMYTVPVGTYSVVGSTYVGDRLVEASTSIAVVNPDAVYHAYIPSLIVP